MESFAGKIAVVTGGGSGMGQELVIQLAAAGCSVATCDLQVELLADTVARAEKEAPPGTRVTGHRCDVSDPASVDAFHDEVLAQHDTDHVNLVFNNAGIAGGGSFILADRAEWERCFNVCWGGVYNGCRAFVPLLVASDDGYLINTSSVNGFWAALGPGIAHTAYSSAKFAVKGFSEALMEDFRLNAPHVKVAVVMPGHIGTNIVANTQRIQMGDGRGMASMREDLEKRGMLPPGTTDEQLAQMMEMMSDAFRDDAPLSAAGAATIILDAVKRGEWRILVGDDAVALDAAVRRDPLAVYGPEGLALAGIVEVVAPESSAVRTERHGRTFVVTIDRPEVRNAVDGPTAALLYEAFAAFDTDDELDVAVFTGAGGTFCAGADLKGLGEGRGNRVHEDVSRPGPMGCTRMLLGKPVVAAVEGHAVAGGLEPRCGADLRVVAADATFGVYCRRWGVPLVDGGTIRLPRLIGQSRALDMILTGRGVGADEALEWGLANRVVDPGQALAAALELAEQLSAFPQACLRTDRLSSYEQWGMGLTDALANETRRGLVPINSGETAAGAARFAAGAGRHGEGV